LCRLVAASPVVLPQCVSRRLDVSSASVVAPTSYYRDLGSSEESEDDLDDEDMAVDDELLELLAAAL
jgi:hypothetical protein